APGGEDYQNGWINPDNPDIVMLAADQGAVISLNGGETWSNWYNQPTAALYHVSADNAFPYRVCSGQQESGSVCIASRGNYGTISERDWLPVGVDEYGYVAPDPLNPDIVYGGRTVTRFDRRTGQTSGVGPVGGRGGVGGASGTFRQVRTMPVVFSEVDKKSLFFANNVLWKTMDGGKNWKAISQDLTRQTYESPKTIGKYLTQESAQPAQRGVIYTVAPSYQDLARIWVGTDDGLIHTTADGGVTWTNVTPPGLAPWAKVSIIDGGRFDPLTAYAAINTLRLDDLRPHIYKTHDGGKTWTEIVNGIPAGETVNAVREDPRKKGLLFASTERTVYVSFDDGGTWRSLRLNLPISSVRDVIVKDDDLVIATHGRGFWILDDITLLRQLERDTPAETTLFKPTAAWRVRWNTSSDMPWPKEEPTGQNPPDGAILNYYLKTATTGPVTLEILQADGRVLRRYASTDPIPQIPDPPSAPWPVYWYRPAQTLSTTAGIHRFVWDVHLQPLGAGAAAGGGLGAVPTQLPIQAIPYNSPTAATTPWAAPGTYTVKLTIDGKSYSQPIVVKQDPRVRTPALEMQRVYGLTNALYFGAVDAQAAALEVGALREQIAKAPAPGAVAVAMAEFERKAAALEGTRPNAGGGRGRGGRGARGGGAPEPAAAGGRGAAPVPAAPDTLWSTTAALSGVMNALQAADVSPTTNTLNALTAAQANATAVMARWRVLKTVDLPALNQKLKAAGAPSLVAK
ncbi:MAG: glycoside hydrolase, partial [Vicinamibacterales bacterium]